MPRVILWLPFITGCDAKMFCFITFKFQRYASWFFQISQVVKVKCYALLYLKFQRYAKFVFHISQVVNSHFTGREMLCFITFKFSKICKGHASQVVKVICYALLRLTIFQRYLKLALSRLTGRESERLCFITILIF